MTEKKSKKRDDSIKIELGMGNLGLGGLFKGVQNLVDLVSELERAGGEIKKEGDIDLSDLKEGMKGVFGFSIKTATGGKPVVEHFGNIKKTPRGAKVEEEREPITDVFDEKDEIRVYAEMPGVNENRYKDGPVGGHTQYFREKRRQKISQGASPSRKGEKRDTYLFFQERHTGD